MNALKTERFKDASNCLDVMLTAMSSSYSFVGLWAGQQLG